MVEVTQASNVMEALDEKAARPFRTLASKARLWLLEHSAAAPPADELKASPSQC